MVEHQRVLGQAHRVVQGRGHDERAEPDARGPRAEPGEHEQGRHQRAAVRLVELGQEHGLEAGALGGQHLLGQLLEQPLERDAAGLDRQDEPEPRHQRAPPGDVSPSMTIAANISPISVALKRPPGRYHWCIQLTIPSTP